MSIRTRGINHPALFGLSYEKTNDFYTRVLDMRLVLEQPNLDDPDSVHLFFEAGPGQFIAYFVPKPGKEIAGRVQSGALNRGYERSVYFRDPNGVVIELLTWITLVPEGADERPHPRRAGEAPGPRRL